MIRLIDKEIINARLSVSGAGLNNLPATAQEKAIAQAQLKKCVEWLKNNSLWCKVLRVDGRFINDKRWQALQKESKDD